MESDIKKLKLLFVIIERISKMQVRVLCKNDHYLTWHYSYINTCPTCSTTANTLSRWKCFQCGESYCIRCRPPPLTLGACPLGHKLEYTASLPYHGCDYCRKSINGPAWRDSHCDYDLCIECQEKYSQED